MSRRTISTVIVTAVLAVAIHADWHFARPSHHRLSLGLTWHWMVAFPLFALVAVYVARVWAADVRRASVRIIGSAVIGAGLVEPLFELLVGGAPFAWAFGAQRNIALLSFVSAGLVAYVVTLAILRRHARTAAAS